MTAQAQQLKAGAPASAEPFRQLPKALTSPLIASDGGAMAAQPTLSFGGLLRRLRTQAGLTQEELAEVATLSPRSVSDLERGISRTARKDTAGRLAEALNLTGPEREVFVAAARGRASAAEVLAARSSAVPGALAAATTRGLPGDASSFTGRYAELEHLLRALTRAVADGVVVVVIHAGSDARDTCRSSTPRTSAVLYRHSRAQRRRPSDSDTPTRIPLTAASMAPAVTTSP
jgi:transcriptional regulator with XRE-family HTH domain